jgi:O-succinylbenzoic acid--CoA ligase
MDPTLLTSAAFWNDPAPVAAGRFPGPIPDIPELRSHVLFQTSGSSGTPKWIALSKDALLASAAAVNEHLVVTPASCWGLALPLHHVGGFGVAARAFVAGCALREFGRKWEAAGFTAWLDENRITHSSLVPTQVHDLVAAESQAPATLRAIVVGGGHLDAATGESARELGWPVLASYGMTEASSQIATQGLASLDTIYQPSPIPLLPIWRAEVSREQKLRIAGPALFSGMLVMENHDWVFKPRASEWHETQDRVMIAGGFLTPLGRADSLVKVLGELVDPEEVERELAALSDGNLAPGSFIVAAVPDARAEHALVPVFDTAADRQTIDAVLSAYAGKTPGFRRLRPAVILDSLPRSPLGKPRRGEIAEQIRGILGLR